MAIIDLRLVPLIESLIVANLDWLAFELVAGVQRGREPLEPANALENARQQVRRYEGLKIEPNVGTFELQPILGDAQVEWAVSYVLKRLTSVIDNLDGAARNLEALTEKVAPGQSTPGNSVIIQLSLGEGSDHVKVDRAGINLARGAIPDLVSALEAWSLQMRGAP